MVLGHATFRVLPGAAPECKPASHDQQPFDLDGWEIVSRADPDFDVVAEKVIAPFRWSTCYLAVRRGEEDEQGFSSFWTKEGSAFARMPGTVCDENDSGITASPDGTYKITHSTTRLLIRRQARAAGASCALPAARSRSSTE